MSSPETPTDAGRVSPDAPPATSELGLSVPQEDNPEQLGADGDVHSGLGVAPYRSAYVVEDGDVGDESAGRGADGTAEALIEQKEHGGP